ncbi:hypothetical protein VP01_680g3 [Puccinia sorghi]|uniref:Uncharacterized protein n=1 Tax=Puccinia sorghi TaxID=27349 RepID=A0A0L6UFC1_9BASI|nr:hypothetical protein VP01_680g3 [Puccinia sorghi]
MHSHCAYFTVTVPKHLHMQTCGVWMIAWLEHAAFQLQEVEQVFFASSTLFRSIVILLFPFSSLLFSSCLIFSFPFMVSLSCVVAAAHLLACSHTLNHQRPQSLIHQKIHIKFTPGMALQNGLASDPYLAEEFNCRVELAYKSSPEVQVMDFNKIFCLIDLCGQKHHLNCTHLFQPNQSSNHPENPPDDFDLMDMLIFPFNNTQPLDVIPSTPTFQLPGNQLGPRPINNCLMTVLTLQFLSCYYYLLLLMHYYCYYCFNTVTQTGSPESVLEGGIWLAKIQILPYIIKKGGSTHNTAPLVLRPTEFFSSGPEMHLGHFNFFSHNFNSLKPNGLIYLRFNFRKSCEKELWKKSKKNYMLNLTLQKQRGFNMQPNMCTPQDIAAQCIWVILIFSQTFNSNGLIYFSLNVINLPLCVIIFFFWNFSTLIHRILKKNIQKAKNLNCDPHLRTANWFRNPPGPVPQHPKKVGWVSNLQNNILLFRNYLRPPFAYLKLITQPTQTSATTSSGLLIQRGSAMVKGVTRS